MEFVNRVEDLRKFEHSLNTHNNTRNNVFFIVANSGVGKSAFTEKISISETLRNTKRIKIKRSGNEKELVKGEYCHRIAKLIDELNSEYPTPNNLMSYKKYMSAYVIVNSIVKFFLNKNGFIDSLSALSLNDTSLTYIKKYIHKIFDMNRFVISIENYHCIDDFSHEFLLELVSQTKNQIFLFELTTSDNRNDDLIYKYSQMYREADCNFTWIELPELEIEECLKIRCLDEKPVNLDEIKNFTMVYQQSNGNLFRMLHFDNNNFMDSSSYSELIYDTTYSLLKSLNNIEQFTISLIALNNGEISLPLLKLLYCDWSIKHELIDFDINLETLVRRKLVVRDGTILRLHDSITNVLVNYQGFETIKPICYRIIVQKYQSIVESKNIAKLRVLQTSTDSIYSMLISLHEKFDPSRLVLMIDELEEYMRLHHSDSLAIKYIETLINNNNIQNKKLQLKINNFILYKAYAIGHLDLIINLYKNNSLTDDLYKYIYYPLTLGHMGHLNSSESILKEAFENENYMKNTRLQLIFTLIKQINILYFEDRETAKQFTLKQLEKDEFIDLPEYGLLLRNYATLLPPQEAIPLILECIDLLEDANLILDSLQSRITLGIRYAFVRDFSNARNELNLVSEKLDCIGYRGYYITNNLAVIDIMNGDLSMQTEQMLLESQMLVSDLYETICITSNLLAYYSLLNDMENAKKNYEKLLEFDVNSYTGEDFIYTYYNALTQYCRMYDTSNLKSHIEEAISHMIIEDELTPYQQVIIAKLKYGISTDVNIDDPYYIIKNYEFDPVMLSYWGFDIDREILNSQLER